MHSRGAAARGRAGALADRARCGTRSRRPRSARTRSWRARSSWRCRASWTGADGDRAGARTSSPRSSWRAGWWRTSTCTVGHGPGRARRSRTRTCMLTLRAVGPGGFGAKVRGVERDRGARGLARALGGAGERARWRSSGTTCGSTIARSRSRGSGSSRRTRSGRRGRGGTARGEVAERAAEHRAIARRNGERILADPGTGAGRDHPAAGDVHRGRTSARFVHRHTDGAAQFAAVMAKVEASPELVRLGTRRAGPRAADDAGDARRRGADGAARPSGGGRRQGPRRRRVGRGDASEADARAAARRGAAGRVGARHRASGDLALVVGYAGTGKSTMLGAAREAWEGAGLPGARGGAVGDRGARACEAGSGIASRTIASLGARLGAGPRAARGRRRAGGRRGRDGRLAAAGAGAGGRRAEVGAKVVLVGDPEQLQAIEAGAAFRALAERHGAAELTEVRRQRRGLAAGGDAGAGDRADGGRPGALRGGRDGARARDPRRRQGGPGRGLGRGSGGHDPAAAGSCWHQRGPTCAALNELARARLRAAGELGAERTVATERGDRGPSRPATG